MAVESFQDLKVWAKGIDLVTEVYRIIGLLPREERFRLSDQMYRAAASVPANIAEGFGRAQTKDFMRFLDISKGSLNELVTYLVVIERTKALSGDELRKSHDLSNEIGRMLTALRRSLRSRLNATRNRGQRKNDPPTPP